MHPSKFSFQSTHSYITKFIFLIRNRMVMRWKESGCVGGKIFGMCFDVEMMSCSRSFCIFCSFHDFRGEEHSAFQILKKMFKPFVCLPLVGASCFLNAFWGCAWQRIVPTGLTMVGIDYLGAIINVRPSSPHSFLLVRNPNRTSLDWNLSSLWKGPIGFRYKWK